MYTIIRQERKALCNRKWIRKNICRDRIWRERCHKASVDNSGLQVLSHVRATFLLLRKLID